MPTAPKTLQDMRCSVENVLKSTLVDSDGILPRESWIQFLQVICSEDTQALLKDQKPHLSVEELLDIIFGPKEFGAPEDFAVSSAVLKGGEIAWTDNLRDYFEKHYRQGGEFHHPDYEKVPDAELFTWLHRLTRIQIWRDAIDLTSGEGGEVYFHYTSELAFRNITAPAKKAAEVWASLNSDPGPKQNAWWGKGVYSVPLPPDQWHDCEQLLDNNFRNMMARDRAAPDKGPEYVEAEYPKRVAFCVPIIINAADAYDVSVRATPEMQAAGKEPGRNLGDKLLNAPGKPQRCCVVLRVNGEDGVTHAQGQLLDALRRRADSSTDLSAKERLGLVLWWPGLYAEALPVLQEVLEICKAKHGPESWEALASMDNLALLLQQMGRFGEALELQRRNVEAMEAMLGPEHRDTLISMGSLANTLSQMGKYGEALELQRKALELRSRTLGGDHPDTLHSINNLAALLHRIGKEDEATELYGKALEIREKILGPAHPDTLMSMANLGIMFRDLGNCVESEKLFRKALAVSEPNLGAEHPITLISLTNLAVTLHHKGELKEALELQRRAVSGREKILGPDHPQTQKSRKRLEELLQDLGLKEVEEDDKES